jgi:chromosome segregation ATPase
MGKHSGKGWTTGKILALVIPICLVVAGVAVALILVLGKSNSDKSGGEETAANEEIVDTYDEISRQAEEAVAQMKDLESQEAASDPQAYEQEMEEAESAFEELAAVSEEAANTIIEVSEDYGELYPEYEDLYTYISDYYAYLEQLTGQAVSQIDYLQSLLPTLEEIQQMEALVGRLENMPATGQFGELSHQLTERAQKALSELEGTQAPESLNTYGSDMESLAKELDSLTQQMSQALSSGNKPAFSSLAAQMNAAVSQADHQLSATISSLLSGYMSTLSQLEASVQSALP